MSQGPKSCDIATQLQNKLNSNVGKQGEKNQTMKDTLIKGKSDTDFHSWNIMHVVRRLNEQK